MAVQPVEKTRATVADFLALPDDSDKRYELIDGKIVEVGKSTDKHSVLNLWLGFLLRLYIQQNTLGGMLKGADGTFRLDEHNVRIPDLSYVTAINAARLKAGEPFTQFAPDLAVEIKSPSQSRPFMHRTARAYLVAGTKLIWVIDYEDRNVLIYRPDQPIIQLAEETDTLNGEDVLPGLSIRLSELFSVIADMP